MARPSAFASHLAASRKPHCAAPAQEKSVLLRPPSRRILYHSVYHLRPLAQALLLFTLHSAALRSSRARNRVLLRPPSFVQHSVPPESPRRGTARAFASPFWVLAELRSPRIGIQKRPPQAAELYATRCTILVPGARHCSLSPFTPLARTRALACHLAAGRTMQLPPPGKKRPPQATQLPSFVQHSVPPKSPGPCTAPVHSPRWPVRRPLLVTWPLGAGRTAQFLLTKKSVRP